MVQWSCLESEAVDVFTAGAEGFNGLTFFVKGLKWCFLRLDLKRTPWNCVVLQGFNDIGGEHASARGGSV